MVKNPPANAGGMRDGGSIPGLGRSPGGVPWTEEPGGLQSTGSQRVRRDRSMDARVHAMCICQSQPPTSSRPASLELKHRLHGK